MKINQLANESMERRENRDMIRQRINQFCKSEYAVDDFFSIAEKHLYRHIDKNCLGIGLARQIPCGNIEHVAVHVLTKFLNDCGVLASTVPLAFSRDSFASVNDYKMSLTKIPYLYKGRSGKFVIKHENIVATDDRENLDGKILDQIRVLDGGVLTEFHYNVRKKIFGTSDHVVDVGGFLKDIAHQSVLGGGRNVPQYLYVRSGVKNRKVSTSEADFLNGQDPRPPADWYYLPYLMLFVDGSCALASTVDEDPRVLEWFSSNVSKIKEICGFAPLIIDTPLKIEVDGFISKLNEAPRSLHDGTLTLSDIVIDPEMHQKTMFHIMQSIEKQIIANC